MRAAVAERFGGPEVLVTREVDDPLPGPGGAVVAVAAADVLWVETMVRRVTALRTFPSSLRTCPETR